MRNVHVCAWPVELLSCQREMHLSPLRLPSLVSNWFRQLVYKENLHLTVHLQLEMSRQGRHLPLQIVLLEHRMERQTASLLVLHLGKMVKKLLIPVRLSRKLNLERAMCKRYIQPRAICHSGFYSEKVLLEWRTQVQVVPLLRLVHHQQE